MSQISGLKPGVTRLAVPMALSIGKEREALKMFRGVMGVSDKLTMSDVEELADDALIKEMKKADRTAVLSYEEGKQEFESIKP